ncbi:MAG: SGNH/GDSL hydrolase family protein [Firmicutes bacterium]|nr:SGNH/GDSL hydrolase family protein [Bacillota bacterium]
MNRQQSSQYRRPTMRRRKRNQRRVAAVLVLAILAGGVIAAHTTASADQHRTTSTHERAVVEKVALPKAEFAPSQIVRGRVMDVGSSVAEGWDDKVGGGYLKRGVVGYSAYSAHDYTLVNHAVAGDTAEKIDGEYHVWLKTLKPQVVVLSWGALDDANAKTPLPVFRATVEHQVALALANHEVVFIVTPPVTRASYTQYPTIEPMYLNAEMQVARSFHSPNVYVFNVFDQMKAYLVAHHQTYVPYMADGWHPNTAGHALAGGLFLDDLQKAFGKSGIAFK